MIGILEALEHHISDLNFLHPEDLTELVDEEALASASSPRFQISRYTSSWSIERSFCRLVVVRISVVGIAF
jgi:hypothetical protein